MSAYTGVMPLLWLPVSSRHDDSSDRGYLERNCIALLSRANGGLDGPSDNWLGRRAVNPAVTRSGLWNVNHIDDPYDPAFLDVMTDLRQLDERSPCRSGALGAARDT